MILITKNNNKFSDLIMFYLSLYQEKRVLMLQEK